jgi:aconitate hydratase
VDTGDELVLEGIREKIKNRRSLTVYNVAKKVSIPVSVSFTDRQIEIILAGGLLNHTKQSRG